MTEETRTDGCWVGAPPVFRLDRADWSSFGVTTLVALIIYLVTMSPGLTLGFSGIYSTGAMYAGVPHPPGYPVWVLYSWFFANFVPVSNVAWRVALGSAIAAAMAGGFTALIVSHGGRRLFGSPLLWSRLQPAEERHLRIISGFVGGMALCFSGTLWSNAVIADVWVLHTLLFAILLWIVTRWMFQLDRRRIPFLVFFICGLLVIESQELVLLVPGLLCAVMISDHSAGRDAAVVVFLVSAAATAWNQFSLLMSFPTPFNWPVTIAYSFSVLIAAGLVIKTRRLGTEWKSAIYCGLSLVMGMFLVFWIPVASMSNPPVNWNYPRTPEGFFQIISRLHYEKAVPTDGFALFMKQLWMMMKTTGRDFGWIYAPLIVVPFCFITWTGREGRLWLAAMVGMCVCVGPLLLAMLNPAFDRQSMKITQPYFLVFYVLLAVWAGVGLMGIGLLISKLTAGTPIDSTAKR